MFNHQWFEFDLAIDAEGRIVARNPALCEPACRAVPEPGTLVDEGWLAWHDNAVKRMDERQCRGCGRWGIFEPRAITGGARTPENCPCCRYGRDDCWCAEACGKARCQMRATIRPYIGPLTGMWIAPLGSEPNGDGWIRIGGKDDAQS